MNVRITAAVVAVLLGVAAPASGVMATPYKGTHHRVAPSTTYDGLTMGRSSHLGHHGCASSASEGNANQQTRPVMQYGQTAGGIRC